MEGHVWWEWRTNLQPETGLALDADSPTCMQCGLEYIVQPLSAWSSARAVYHCLYPGCIGDGRQHLCLTSVCDKVVYLLGAGRGLIDNRREREQIRPIEALGKPRVGAG